ncbi:hypothetical protein DVR11_24485 [Paracoccus versutus]|nr:hypothetical protein DVR11_24485 [Paracoccus versutus]
MACGMVQRKPQRGQRLAAAGGHGQGEQSRRHGRAAPDMGQDIGAQAVDPAIAVELRHMRV